ncbi:MAG: efflux RND transporter permease subunit [Acidobacteria bacterium]|nr:efflux RND transporter permease subunit [Acidobacteriota bacterium]
MSLTVVGAASYFKLQVDRFPTIDLPTVTVRIAVPGASPEGSRITACQAYRRGCQHG